MSAVRKSKITVVIGGALVFSHMTSAASESFDAGKVMKEMKPDEQYAYTAGVIEGLAIARYHKDAKNKDGMGCIYDWFYKDKANLKLIMDAFDRYPTYPPGSIIDVLVKRKYGE